MRMDRMTSRLQAALADAQSLAVGQDHSQLEPEHLLTAALDQQGGGLAALLQRSGCDASALRRALGDRLEALPRVSKPTGDVAIELWNTDGNQ